jgi:uncharacterized protein YbjT (DUF2867 family)
MTSPILVTGGTGRLGSHVVRRRWAKGVLDGRAALGVPTGPWQAPSRRAGPVPRKAARAARADANLAPDRAVGLRTWEDFLASPGDRSGPT